MNVLTVQDGVLTRHQALQLMSRHQLYAHVKAERWANPATGVFVNHNGPLTEDQRDWVALLAAPPGSVLGGLSALRLDGFTSFKPPAPVVVAKMGASKVAYKDMTLHWSSFLDDRDVHPLRRPRRTRPARSVVDAASWEPQEKRAREIVLAAAQRGIIAPRQLREALTRRGACRHRGLIVESYLDAAGGIQSLPERDFDRLRRECGLPAPDRQSVLRRADGKYYLDVWWIRFNLACEIHGIPHMQVENWDDHLIRGNEVTIDGRRTPCSSACTPSAATPTPSGTSSAV